MVSQPTSVKVTGVVARVFGTLFFGVFFSVGLAMTVYLGRETWRNSQPHFWDAVPATIVSSRVGQGPEAEETGAAYVQYRYSHGGRSYTSERIDVDDEHPDGAEMLAFVQRLPAGSRTTCFVDPKRPEMSVLRRQSPWLALIVLFPMVFLTVGVVGIIGVWTAKLDGSKKPEPVSSLSRRASQGRRAGYFFFSIFALVGGVTTYLFAVKPLLRVAGARAWVETPCQIVSSEVRPHSDSDGTTYSVGVVYRYRFRGREYESNRYSFANGSSSGYDGKAEVVATLPPGKRGVCYVNPDDPVDAVLVRGLRWEMLVGLFPLVFMLVGVGGLVGMFHSARRRAAGVVRSGGVVGAGTGRRAPRARGTRTGKFLGLLCICLFWNGIVSVFVYHVVSEWIHGRGNWFLTLFMMPFLLIGLAIIGGLAYQFLALFNPRAKLTLSSADVPLGETVEIDWSLPGGVPRVRQLTIAVIGQEEATYRRGTSSATDTEMFFRKELVNTEERGAIAAGRASVLIPGVAMHSFSAAHNKIVWFIQVKGEVPYWPDVNDEYELNVIPHREVV